MLGPKAGRTARAQLGKRAVPEAGAKPEGDRVGPLGQEHGAVFTAVP